MTLRINNFDSKGFLKYGSKENSLKCEIFSNLYRFIAYGIILNKNIISRIASLSSDTMSPNVNFLILY